MKKYVPVAALATVLAGCGESSKPDDGSHYPTWAVWLGWGLFAVFVTALFLGLLYILITTWSEILDRDQR